MFCPYCASEYADWAQKCPYCGAVNEAADEQVYLAHLEEVRQRLSQVDDEAEESYRETVKGEASSALRTAAKIAVVLLAIALIVSAVSLIKDHRENVRQYNELEWEQVEFPILNSYYEAGDYQAIFDEEYGLYAKDTPYSLYNWEHYSFLFDYVEPYSYILATYPGIAEARGIAADEAQGLIATYEDFGILPSFMEGENRFDGYVLGEALHAALRLKYETTDDQLKNLQKSWESSGLYGLSADEVAQVKEYRKQADVFFKTALGWSEAKTAAFYEECTDNGWLSNGPCFDKADELMASWGY